MKTNSIVFTVAFLLLETFASSARAGELFFGEYEPGDSTNEALEAEQDFLSKFDNILVEDFEGFNVGELASPENPLVLNFGDSTATLTGGGAVRDADFAGLHAISGEKYWSLTFAEEVQDTYNIQFNQPQAALSFWATDMGDFARRFSLKFTYEDGSNKLVEIPHTLGSKDASELYLGYLSPDRLFTNVEFLSDGPIRQDGFGLDNIFIAIRNQFQSDESKSIPEPTSVLGLFVVGASGLISARKRQFNK